MAGGREPLRVFAVSHARNPSACALLDTKYFLKCWEKKSGNCELAQCYL